MASRAQGDRICRTGVRAGALDELREAPCAPVFRRADAREVPLDEEEEARDAVARREGEGFDGIRLSSLTGRAGAASRRVRSRWSERLVVP
jgi:hypothetical protein